ncbi:MAG: hypothetical protein LBT00_04920 [Spirochaetaceae bacterium]|nr:hypothetical protein [Spirochaetaceae bacterium]
MFWKRRVPFLSLRDGGNIVAVSGEAIQTWKRRVPFLSFSIIHLSFSIRAKRALRAPQSVKIRFYPAQSVVKNASIVAVIAAFSLNPPT